MNMRLASAAANAPPTLAIDPFDEAFLADPYAHHDAIRDAGPVVWLEPIGAFGMARFAQVQPALRDFQTYCSGRGVGLADFAKEEPWRPPSLLLEADPPLHDRTRKIVNKILSRNALLELRPVWEQRAEALVSQLVEKRRFDAATELAEEYPMQVFPQAMGLRDGGRDELLTYAAAVFNAFGPHNDVFRRGSEAAKDAVLWVADACKREKLKPGGWGMAVYEAADLGDCTPEEAERLVRSFLSAGLDTTVNGIAHLVLAFASFPGEWRKLRERPELLKNAFTESLRWDATVQTFFRTTTREVEVEGVTIPEGSKVLLFLAAANRDPRQWEDPETFKIDRQANAQLAFGYGIHRCVGQIVAQQETELVLAALLKRVSAIRLTCPPERRLNNTLHAIAHLPIDVVPN